MLRFKYPNIGAGSYAKNDFIGEQGFCSQIPSDIFMVLFKQIKRKKNEITITVTQGIVQHNMCERSLFGDPPDPCASPLTTHKSSQQNNKQMSRMGTASQPAMQPSSQPSGLRPLGFPGAEGKRSWGKIQLETLRSLSFTPSGRTPEPE